MIQTTCGIRNVVRAYLLAVAVSVDAVATAVVVVVRFQCESEGRRKGDQSLGIRAISFPYASYRLKSRQASLAPEQTRQCFIHDLEARRKLYELN